MAMDIILRMHGVAVIITPDIIHIHFTEKLTVTISDMEEGRQEQQI